MAQFVDTAADLPKRTGEYFPNPLCWNRMDRRVSTPRSQYEWPSWNTVRLEPRCARRREASGAPVRLLPRAALRYLVGGIAADPDSPASTVAVR